MSHNLYFTNLACCMPLGEHVIMRVVIYARHVVAHEVPEIPALYKTAPKLNITHDIEATT